MARVNDGALPTSPRLTALVADSQNRACADQHVDLQAADRRADEMQVFHAVGDNEFGEADRGARTVRRHRQFGARSLFLRPVRPETRRLSSAGSPMRLMLHCRDASAMK